MLRQLFDRETCTYTYLLADPDTGSALLIDPVEGHEDRDLSIIQELGLRLKVVLETHVHADHVTSAANLRDRTGCQIIVPSRSDAKGADQYIPHGETVRLDSIALEVRHTPGHTSGSACFVDHAHGHVYTGDTLLIRGCGRTDFQSGSNMELYRSVHEQLFSLPDATIVYPGHDYKGRLSSTIGEEKLHNPRLGNDRPPHAFADIMDTLNLSYPARIDEAVPANLNLGRRPDAWHGLPRNASGARQVTTDWVKEQAASLRLIDVREPSEYHGPLGHVPNAELVPLSSLADAAQSWNRLQPLVMICRSGGRSDRAARQLEAMGFDRVASMTGGTVQWMNHAAPPACG